MVYNATCSNLPTAETLRRGTYLTFCDLQVVNAPDDECRAQDGDPERDLRSTRHTSDFQMRSNRDWTKMREGKRKATVAASAGGWDAGRARQPESLNVADVVRRP